MTFGTSKLDDTTIAGGILIGEARNVFRRHDVDFRQDGWIANSSQESDKSDEVFLSTFFQVIDRPIRGSGQTFDIDRNGIAGVSCDNNIDGLLIPERKSGGHAEPV